MTQPYFDGPVAPSVSAASVADLRSRASNLFQDGNLARIIAVNTFEWDSASVAVDDGAAIIIPDDITHPAPGRWLVIAAGGGGAEILEVQVFS